MDPSKGRILSCNKMQAEVAQYHSRVGRALEATLAGEDSSSLRHWSSASHSSKPLSLHVCKWQGWVDAFKTPPRDNSWSEHWYQPGPVTCLWLYSFPSPFLSNTTTKCKMKRGMNPIVQSYFMEKKVRAQRQRSLRDSTQPESEPSLLLSPGSHSTSFFSFKFLEHFADKQWTRLGSQWVPGLFAKRLHLLQHGSLQTPMVCSRRSEAQSLPWATGHPLF